MTDITSTNYPSTEPVEVPKAKKKKRIFLWFFLAVQAVFIYWIVSGIGGADITDCSGLKGTALEDCEFTQAAEGVGTGIGVALVVGLWFGVNCFIGVIYGIYRLAKRS